MRKNVLLILVMFIAGSLSAQLYVGGKLGYNFGAQKTAFTTTAADFKSIDVNFASLGQGLVPGLKVGYFLNDNWGVELGFDYFMGSVISYNVVGFHPLAGSYLTTIELQSTQIRLSPQLVYKSDMGMYGRFGMMLPVSGKTTANTTSVIGTKTYVKNMENKGTFSLGFTAALGYEYELSDALKLFGEFQYTGLAIKSKSSLVTEYTIDGADQLGGMTTYQKETVSVDVLNASSNNTTYNTSADMSKAQDVLRTSSNYSAFGINIGVNFAF